MKRRFIQLLLFIAPLALSAQNQPTIKELKKHQEAKEKSRQKESFVHSLDTLFKNGEPYCLLKILNKDGGTIYEAAARSMSGNDEMFVEYRTAAGGLKYQHRYYFIRQGKMADVPVDVFKKIDEFIGEFDLYHAGGINTTAMEEILKKYPVKAEPENEYKIAVNEQMIRKWEAPIKIYGRDVMQDNRIIAKIEKRFILQDGDILKRIIILNDRGNKVAHADAMSVDNFIYTVHTPRDKKEFEVKSSAGNESMDVITFLVKAGYL